MIREHIREELKEKEFNDTVIFDNPSFDDSIVGYTEDGRLVYDYDSMIVELAGEDGISLIEAQEFIDYNTIRALPYAGEKAPIIIYAFESDT